MAVRTLLVLVAFAVLYGCGQASSPVERQEKQGGVEQAQGQKKPKGGEATGPDTMGNIPISGVIGENVETPSFDYRILDVFTTDHYYYLEDPSVPFERDAFSEAGKFVVLTYSMTNTSPQPVTANLGALLHVRADDKVEVYDESDQVTHPYSGGIIGGPELAPRQVLLGQFIFDVPTDVEPELVAVLYEDEMEEPRGEAGAVNLTEKDPQGARPEEILALQWQYNNMLEWEEIYELHAQESKDRVPRETFVSALQQDLEQADAYAIEDYSFPTIEVDGDHATIERVFDWATPDDFGQDKATQEMVLEDEGWRVLMRQEQYEFFLGGEETTQLPIHAPSA